VSLGHRVIKLGEQVVAAAQHCAVDWRGRDVHTRGRVIAVSLSANSFHAPQG